MRRGLVSVAIAIASAAGVIGSGWALQAAALPRPKPATLVAADASVWLHEHRLVVDVFHVHHRRATGACLSGWFPRPNGSSGRVSLLAVTSQPILRIAPTRHTLLGTVRHGRARPRRMLAVVGCSGELSRVLVEAAQSGGRLSTERSYAANRPAIALELEPAKDARLTLYVSPRTYRPLVAFAYVEGQHVTARLYMARLTSRWSRKFHVPVKRGRTSR